MGQGEYIGGTGRTYWWGRKNILVALGKYIGSPGRIYWRF